MKERINAALDKAGAPPLHGGRTEWMVKKLHISQGTASRWLSGHTTPSIEHIHKIAKVTGCDPVWLQTGHSGETTLDEGLLEALLVGALSGCTSEPCALNKRAGMIAAKVSRLYKRLAAEGTTHSTAREISRGIVLSELDHT